LSRENIISNRSYEYVRRIIQKDKFKLALYEEIIEVWHKILDEPHVSLCNLIIDIVKMSFGRTPEIHDIKAVLSAYREEFDKIRGTIHINKQPELKPAHVQQVDKVINVILRLRKKKNGNIIPIREIMPYVFRQIKSDKVNVIINELCNIGFCELIGRKVNVLDEKSGE
jgi:hypothetical protein